MKSAAKGGAAANAPTLSQIPLPRRKSSGKGDKILEFNDTDSELGGRSPAKMSLLGASSFCCTSGQKEDYLPEARFLPTPKKKTPPAKQEPGSPLVPPSKPLLRSRRKIVESNSEDTLSQASELGLRKLSNEDIKLRPPADSRLRPPDQRGKITPSSPHRKLSRDPLPFQKEILEAKKAGELGTKVRKDLSPRIAAKESRKCKEVNPSDKCYEKGLDFSSKSSKVSSPKICRESLNLFHTLSDPLTSSKTNPISNSLALSKVTSPVKIIPSERIYNGTSDVHGALDKNYEKMASDGVCHLSFGDARESFDNHMSKLGAVVCSVLSQESHQDSLDCVMVDQNVVMHESHNSDDFDCPCCDKTPTAVDGPVIDSDLNVSTSWDVTPWTSVTTKGSSEDRNQKELALRADVEALRDDLEEKRLRLKTQEEQVQRLEEELIMMEQLKNELEKEKELRKIAEDKLLQVLDHQKEIQREQNEKRTESKGTQKDDTDLMNPSESSPLMMGYESRVRRYQTYISKLEKDNQMLVNELKKLKDMSPLGQEAQAQLLLEKLSEIHRSSQRQQLQYESCLDEVANRLVQTLLVQKRLEEECKILHLRVEQLEQENVTLMELMDDDKSESVTKTKAVVVEMPNDTKDQIDDPSHHASSPNKKTSKPSISFEEKIDEPPRTTYAKKSEPKSPVTSPLSPTAKPGSKIPAFGNTKVAVIRKKSKAESQTAKAKSEIHPTSPTSMPNIKSPSTLHPNEPTSPTSIKSPLSKNKTIASFENSKGTSVKRKRLSRNGSPAEKGAKDSKQRMKNSHVRWERRQTVPEDLSSLSNGDISPVQAFNRQQHIWSFNCEVNREILLPESSRKIDDSIDAFKAKLDDGNKEHLEEFDKQNFPTEASASIGGANRTRDEGYSTMSSDLQPDSAADTTVSEQEVSVTYTVTEKELRCISDDSVTECLDGSMCSSSDSGFGPLHLIANSKTSDSKPSDPNLIEQCNVKEPLKTAQEFFRNISTVRHKDQIASVKPTIRNINPPSSNEDKPSSLCDTNSISNLKTSTEEFRLSPLLAKNILEKLDGSFQTSSPQKSKFDYISMLDYWNCDDLDIASRGKTWHLGSKKTDIEDRHLGFCSRQSYIEDCFFDVKVKTAEKATLTEPEEDLWREMALAPFIDESIWSLYSSEGDVRMKHFPLEPLLSEPSLDKLISECNPCIIITEETDLPSNLHNLPNFVEANVSNNSAGADVGMKGGLERVASDTVLYLKDAIHELEDSMHRGLKSSKNVSSLHNNSTSESEASPSGLKPELLLSLNKAMTGQNHLVWPSPTRSSSTSSVQSSASCHVISDETDDVDLLRTSSRKGSQDLSSASDAEYENLEHKDFVERWLQSEITQNPASRLKVPEPQPSKKTVSLRRKSSLPCSPSVAISRPRFLSYPQTAASSLSKLRQRTGGRLTPSTTVPRKFESCCSTDDIESQGVDPEAKEFNGDFYKLCSVGSLRSLDHFSPAKSADAQNKLSAEPLGSSQRKSGLTNSLSKREKTSKLSIQSVSSNKKKLGLANSLSKPKPTGLVKPTRPVTLVVGSGTPDVPDRSQSKSLYFQSSTHVCTSEQKSSIHVCTSTEQNAKTAEVPQHSYHPVLQNKSSQSSLPVPEEEQKRPDRTVAEVRTPRKILVKCSPGHGKRHHGGARQRLSKEGCGTAWIHLQANSELSDPMARISLLDSLKAPSSSSSDEEEDVLVIQTNSHLHRICQERRHKVKASAHNPLFDCKKRSSIMGRRELFYRFGDKEREAIACFDFLEELPTSSGDSLSLPTMSPPREHFTVRRTSTPPSGLCLIDRETPSKKERIAFLSPIVSSKSSTPLSSHKRIKLPDLWNQPLSQRMSSNLQTRNCELLDHISLSDSCAESYSSTPDSCYEEAS